MHTQDGLKPIEDINVGDLVASKNDITGETDWKRVSQLFINYDKTVFDVTVTTDDDQQEVLGATHEHPFWVEGKGWVKAGELVAGDRVHLRDGQLASISSIKAREGQHTTYNFEVEDFHTYFVGEQGVWVHNTCVDDVAELFAKKAPTIGGGGSLEKLSPNEVRRIQNAANRSGKDIAVVGSRVNPNKQLHSKSGYDFVVDAKASTRNSLSRSLPGSKNINEGIPNNQDIFKGQVDTSLPHVIFHPQ